jgi:acyl carrier protein
MPFSEREAGMETASAVLPVVREHIAAEMLRRPGARIDEDADIIREGILTSLQTVELVMFLEERFGIEIDAEEVEEENFASLGTITALVERKLAGRRR